MSEGCVVLLAAVTAQHHMCKAAIAAGYKQSLELLVGVLLLDSKQYIDSTQSESHMHPGQDSESIIMVLGNRQGVSSLSTLQVCLLYNAGEVSLIEYGQNEILGTCRTEHMSPYLISVRINPPRGNLAEEKKMAYLVDKQTAKVTDLQAGVVLATVSHGAKIDWLVRPAFISTAVPPLH